MLNSVNKTYCEKKGGLSIDWKAEIDKWFILERSSTRVNLASYNSFELFENIAQKERMILWCSKYESLPSAMYLDVFDRAEDGRPLDNTLFFLEKSFGNAILFSQLDDAKALLDLIHAHCRQAENNYIFFSSINAYIPYANE